MTNYFPPSNPERPEPGRSYWSTTPPWYVAMVAAILAVMMVILVILLFRAGDDSTTSADGSTSTVATATSESTTTSDSTTTTEPTTTSESSTTPESTSTSDSTTTTTAATTTTTALTTTASTTVLDPEAYRTAVWPWFASDVRYDDPVEAAEGFAKDFVGFNDPILGPFMQGDSRSGEVEVWNGPNRRGPVTVVLVRQLGPDNTWWVLGSVGRDIRIEEPDALDAITSPLTVSGQSVAYEAHVDVALRADGSNTPVLTSYLMGGATEMAPFVTELTFTSPGQSGGALILFTTSAEDGDIEHASVMRIFYAE